MTRARTRTCVQLASALLLCVVGSARAQEPFPGLNAHLTNVLAESGVPGLSIAIVRNDSVIYARGFGVLTTGASRRVDEHTLFEIGSVSKSFTATLVAMNVSDGRMRFDDLVSQHLANFRLADPVANANVTIRDLLTHRTGTGRGELVWIGSGASREELLHRMRFLPPESPFRSRYSYQNVMYMAAGEAAGRAAGSTWDALVVERIFRPLRMTRSVTSTQGLQDANVATSHGAVRDSVFAKPHANMDNIAPAGAIVSSAHDMAQWVRFQLADGTYEGTRLLASGPFRETHVPHIVAGGGSGGGDGERITNFTTYALGWLVSDYRGQLLWSHSGGTDGMSSNLGLLPNQKFGVVVLTNMAGSQVATQVMRWVLDRQLNVPLSPVADAQARAVALAQRTRADSIAAAQTNARRVPGPPPLPLSAYAGTYADSLYGEASVAVVDGVLMLRRGEWYGPLEYWNGTNFRWTVPHQPIGQPPYIKFDIAADDRVTGLYFGTGDTAALLRRRPAPPAGQRTGGSP